MQVICRIMLIWSTTVMLCVQAVIPTNVFGCECQKPNRKESVTAQEKPACCSAPRDSQSGTVERNCCCCAQHKQVTTTKKSAKKRANRSLQVRSPQCSHENQSNLMQCGCANSFAPAIPSKSKLTEDRLLLHAFLTHPVFCSLSNSENEPACLYDCAPLAATPQNFAQILFCVALI